ncbi:MAG: hypothetical protein M3433_06325 [Actinomycetota bacterium]|nr:hypothetical protein [Actinomycetota bacterium]
MLLYAQPVARIVRLTAEDAELNPEAGRLRLGPEPIFLPSCWGAHSQRC